MQNIKIINLCYGANFGANIVAYSLQYALSSLHYSSCHINIFPEDAMHSSHSEFNKFKRNVIHLSLPVFSISGLLKMNPDIETIIVGSDQVFRYNALTNMLPWAWGKKRFISYAASFGHAEYKNMPVAKRLARKLLSRFDAHSVRESSGVSIMKNTFGLDAIQVLDPTLLLNPEDYQPIIDSEPCSQPEKYVGVMFLDDEHWTEFKTSNLYKMLSTQGYEIVNIVKDEQGKFHSVPQWLSYIKNASLMVTDSFHGTVFSIIYKKQFITRATANRGNARIESLCKTLSIPLSRFYPSFDAQDDSQFDTQLDFDPIWKRIEEERVVSLDYLKKSLALEPTYKDYSVADY